MQIYANFPKPGVDFVDVSPVFQDVAARKQCLDQLTETARKVRPDVIVALESRGFIYGSPIADRLDLPFVMVRKPGKLPGPILSHEVKTEYSTTMLELQVGAIPKGSRVIIVDDVLATGGSVAAAKALVEAAGGIVHLFMFHVVLEKFAAEQKANGIDPMFVATPTTPPLFLEKDHMQIERKIRNEAGFDDVAVRLFADVATRSKRLEEMTLLARNAHADVIVAIESRGFLFGASIAHSLELPLVVMQKCSFIPWRGYQTGFACHRCG